MTDFLHRIESYKREEIAAARRALSPVDLERRARDMPPARGFRAAIDTRLASGGVALIAEIKKASPSKGLIRADFDPPTLARDYQAGGATCLSVLTDGPSFQGRPEHIGAARAAVDLPVLRKDFMFDPYQVLQARAWGADCILLILAAVDDPTATELEDAALSLGMDVLIEVHDLAELHRASRRRSRLLGINNRALGTFTTTLTTTESLAPHVPTGCTVISESGISSRGDIARLAEVGVSAFLVGESLMRSPDVRTATQELLAGRTAPLQAVER